MNRHFPWRHRQHQLPARLFSAEYHPSMAIAAISSATLFLRSPRIRVSLPRSSSSCSCSCSCPSAALSFAPLLPARRSRRAFSPKMEASGTTMKEMEKTTNPTEEGEASAKYKKIFVAGATGRTGRRVVEQLLAAGFEVRAGSLDVDRARNSLSSAPNLEIVRADVTDGPEKLAEAIGDSDAVICATSFRYSWDVFAPWKVDNLGTVNLVEACRKKAVGRFILVSSILVNGAAWGQILNPAYVFLNAFGLTLIAKLQAEKFIRRSGINYTIIRPGGLKEDPPSGNIVMEPEDTLYQGSISRAQVAEVAVGALLCPESSFKVVEIIAGGDAPERSLSELFGSIRQR